MHFVSFTCFKVTQLILPRLTIHGKKKEGKATTFSRVSQGITYDAKRRSTDPVPHCMYVRYYSYVCTSSVILV